ncbi:MAG TPA: CapA family protein [Gemmatimonadaceae bacterium]
MGVRSGRSAPIGGALALLAAFAAGAAAQDSTATARKPVRVCAGGDVTLGTNLDTIWAKTGARRLKQDYGLSADPASLLAPLKPLFADADIVLVNVEMAIGSGAATRKCNARSQNCYMFRAPVNAAAAIRGLGHDSARVVGNVANNHARDAGNDGVPITAGHLKRAGVSVVGMDTLATPVITERGDTIGVLGFYTSSETPDVRDTVAVRRHVARAVEKYGTVIVTAHIGAEGVAAQRTRDSTEWFLASRIDRGNPVAFARAAFEGGATLIVAHGPHVLRAAEWRDDRLVLYSMGNLVTYGPFSVVEPLNRGAVACVDLLDRLVTHAELRPTMQRASGAVAVDQSRRALRLVDSLSALDFPTTGAQVLPSGELVRRP